MQQNGWIKKLSDAFPEDTFTFDGHPEQVLTGTDYSEVKVKSELYPDVYISLWKEKGELYTNYLAIAYEEDIYDELYRVGELYTNYLAIAYEEDIYDELYRVLDGRFPCSSYVIRQANQRSYKGYPVEDIGARKFIKNYMDYDCQVLLFCDDESQIPDDDEIKDIFLELLDDEPRVYNLQLYYFDAKDADLAEDNPLKYYKVRYQLFMTEEDHINNMYADYNGGTENDHYIVRDMDI